VAEFDPEKQRDFALDVVRQLRSAGYEAYWAGGCVRDRLLGRVPKDYDVATNAIPPQIAEVFRRRKTLELGAAFGVITVLGPHGAGQIEVATFREDSAYSDGRHPDSVTFTSAEHDAQRRDFTINGLFFDPLSEKVLDFVNGQEDLRAGIVRAIGEARQRFAEDKLRMLRAVRFAASLEYAIDAGTRSAIEEMASEIGVVSPERVTAELRLMLMHRHRATAIELLAELGLLAQILPELVPESSAWPPTLDALRVLEQPTFPLALATLLHREVSPPAVTEISRRWRLSNREAQRTVWLVEQAGALDQAEEMPWPALQRILIHEGAAELLALEQARLTTGARPVVPIEFCRRLLEQPADELNPPALITGDDLIELGIPRGNHYQQLLERVRDAQLLRSIRSREEALALVWTLWAAK